MTQAQKLYVWRKNKDSFLAAWLNGFEIQRKLLYSDAVKKIKFYCPASLLKKMCKMKVVVAKPKFP